MARFLVAWEYGEGLGHVRRVVPIGRALRARGHEVVFAFRDATQLVHAAREGFTAWPAAVLKRPSTFDPAPINGSHLLLSLGFADTSALAGALRGWASILHAVQPTVLVADYAPLAMIAAHRHGVPRATVGAGFTLPPAAAPLPAMRPGAAVDEASLEAADARLVSQVAEALGDAAAWSSAPDIFHGDLDLLTTFAEMDPWGPREVRYTGPILAQDEGGRDAAWPERGTEKVVAYLRPRDAGFAATLEALRGSSACALVAAPGLARDAARSITTPSMHVHEQALRLGSVLREARLAIGHGGAGFTAAALRAGVPLALLPMHLEQDLTARRLAAQGLAVVLDARGGAATLRAGLAAALADEAMREHARAFAARHGADAQEDAADVAAAALERLAAA
jgi:UDP:flavonoid glycosyltransferase YjiC (YdhE family)